MTKYHINKHGVPAPCRATKGNCPLGGDESHFSTQEEAQEYADKINAAEYGHLPEITEKHENKGTKGNCPLGGGEPHFSSKEEAQAASDEINVAKYGHLPEKTELSDEEAAKVGKKLTDLIGKRKNAVQEPDFPDGKDTFQSSDDLETLVHLRSEYITTQEHDPVKNVQSMFDHVANKSGKLYRYDDKDNPYLETHNYNFNRTIGRHKAFLESEEYFNPDYYGDNGETEEELRNNFKADVENHEKLHEYTQNLAIEYGKDFEKNVVLSGKYSLDAQDKIQEEYRKALVDKVSKFIQSYDDDDDW